MKEDKYFHISLINNFKKQYILTYKNVSTPKIKFLSENIHEKRRNLRHTSHNSITKRGRITTKIVSECCVELRLTE